MSADILVENSIETAEAIISGLIKGGGWVSQEKVNEVIHAVAVMRTPRLLGVIPLRNTKKIEHEISEALQDES